MAASTYETVMIDVLARLKASGAGWISAADVRRAHRTIVPRDKSPAVHLIDGEDAPYKGATQKDCGRRSASFTVSIFVRSDAGPTAADPLKVEVMRRLSPYTMPYAVGVNVDPGRITIDTEIGDQDPVRVNMDFELKYPASEWALS